MIRDNPFLLFGIRFYPYASLRVQAVVRVRMETRAQALRKLVIPADAGIQRP